MKHAALNRELDAARERAFAYEDALTEVYAKRFRALARDASARFREIARPRALVAAGGDGLDDPPDWAPPDVQELMDASFFDGLSEREARRIHLEALKAALPDTKVAGAAVSLDIVSPFAQPLLEQVGTKGVNLGLAGRDVIVKVIGNSYDQGLSVQDTAVELKAQIEHLSQTTARMQARTDLNGLANGASLASVQALGDAAPSFKQWLATFDDRTRPTHMAAEGQTVPVDQPFTVGIEPLMYPGDPTGSDAETINCRCTIIYTDELEGTQTEDTVETAVAGETFITSQADAIARVPAATRAEWERDGLEMYHVGPASARDSIAENGLVPGGEGVGSPHPGQQFTPEVKGVYGHDTEEGAFFDMESVNEGAGELATEGEDPRFTTYRFHLDPLETARVGIDNEDSLLYTSTVPPTKIDVWDLTNEEWVPLRAGAAPVPPAAEFTPLKRLDAESTNPVYTSDLNGKPVIVKPEVQIDPVNYQLHIAGGRDLERELAAQVIADQLTALDPELALQTARFRIMDAPVMGRAGVTDLVPDAQPLAFSSVSEAEIRAAAIYDTVIGNVDRHIGNILLNRNGITLIDQGLSFPSVNQEKWVTSYFTREVQAKALQDNEIALLERLRSAMMSGDLRGSLTGTLTPAEIDATQGRIEWMIRNARLPSQDDWAKGLT